MSVQLENEQASGADPSNALLLLLLLLPIILWLPMGVVNTLGPTVVVLVYLLLERLNAALNNLSRRRNVPHTTQNKHMNKTSCG